MRHVVGGRAKTKQAASTSQMGRYETEVLTQPKNLSALMELSGMWIDTVRQRKAVREIILDMDSSVSETYGEREGSAYNGHFACPDMSGLPSAVLFQPVRRLGTGIAA